MNLRKTAVAVVATGLLAVPVAAIASPVPDPPTRTATDTVQAAIDQLIEAYAAAPLSQKRSIHNEIVLLVNIGHGAL